MNRIIQRFLSFTMIFMCLVLGLPVINVAAAVDLPQDYTPAVITGFDVFDVNEHALSLVMEYKPSLDEICEMMPQTLEVYLNDEAEQVSIDVDWYCVGEDYETSESFYFQFSPIWDESRYVLSDEIDLLTEAPYIAVYFRPESEGVSTYAVTNQYYETFIFEYLTDTLGYHTAAACGAMANIYAESSFVPTNLQNTFEKTLGFTDATYTKAVDNGSYANFVRDSAGYGLCQWTYWSRKQGLYDYAKSLKKSIGDPGMQLSFLDKELMAGATGKYMKSAPNTEQGCYDVGYYFCQNFERPAQEKDEKSIVRGNLAKNYYWEEYSDNIDYTIKISGHNKPGTLKQGGSFSVTGTVTSGARIRSLTAGVYNLEGKLVAGKTIAPNVKSYDLKAMNSYLNFKTMSPGFYYYRVSATNAMHTKKLIDQFFVVISTSRNMKEGTYIIVPRVNRSMAVSIENHSGAAGSKLHQEINTDSNYQYFQLVYVGNGYYTIKNTGSGLYVEVPASFSAGSSIHQTQKSDSTRQKWQIIPVGDSYCLLAHDNPSYCMSIQNGATTAGAKLKIAAVSGNIANKFQFITGRIDEVFRDVNEYDWYAQYVEYVYKKGLMNGNDGLFEPNKSITKAQVAQVIYNLDGKPANSDQKVFSALKDVYKGEWYANAVAWAYSKGIVTGDLNSKKFSPNEAVTREQLALMVYRYAKYKGYNVSYTSDFEGLIGAENISNWSLSGMKWAVGAGLISGVEKNGLKYIDPQGSAGRAQVAAILQRFCENVKPN